MAHSAMRTVCHLATTVLMLCAHATVHADGMKNAAWAIAILNATG